MSRPDPHIVFAASLSRVTGDGEQFTVNFNASDQGELWKRLTQASEVANRHMKKHNDKVLDLTEEIDQKAQKVRADIERQHRKQLADAGLLPPAFVNTDPLIPKEANGAADPSGADDLRGDPPLRSQ